MKKLFTLIAAALMGLTASAQQVWDFTVIPTQTIDGTGNIEVNAGTTMPTDPNAWGIIYNKAGVLPGSEFMATSSAVFEPTKGLKWELLGDSKMIIWRNYPAEYGGVYLFFNKEAGVSIPAKEGQTIEFVAASAKNNKTITSDGIDAPIEVLFGDAAYSYATYSCKATVDNPVLNFQNNICIQKITVSGEGSSSTATETLVATLDASTNTGTNDGSTWNFKDGYTITNELGNRNYSDDGKYMTIGKVTASQARYHKINVPAGVMVSAIEMEGYTNNDTPTAYSYVYKINDVTYDEMFEAHEDAIIANRTAKYGFPNSSEKNGDGSQKVATHKIAIENPTAGGSLNIGFTGTNAVRMLFRLYSGGTTGIEQLETVVVPASDVIYNLAGQKVGSDYKGIVIKNGKKFVMK